MASWVTRANPVVSTTVRPASVSSSIASRAPAIGAIRPPSTSSPYALSKAELARRARSSAPNSSRKTEILDSPMVARTYASFSA